MAQIKNEGKSRYVSGSKDVVLDYGHRFTNWFSDGSFLLKWKEHFDVKGVKTAIGMNTKGVALFTEHKILEDD